MEARITRLDAAGESGSGSDAVAAAAERSEFVASNGYIALDDFAREERRIDVVLGVFNGERVVAEIVYNPGAITDDIRAGFLDDQVQATSGTDMALSYARMLAAVVLEWNMGGPLHREIVKRERIDDCTDEDDEDCEEVWVERSSRKLIVPRGEMVPLDANIIRHMRTDFNVKMVRKIFEDLEGAGPERRRPSRKRR